MVTPFSMHSNVILMYKNNKIKLLCHGGVAQFVIYYFEIFNIICTFFRAEGLVINNVFL